MFSFSLFSRKQLVSVIVTRGIKRPALNTSQLKEGKRTGALAMKVGMLTLFDKWGVRHPVTVLHIDNCQVVQAKTEDKHGYIALQLGIGEAKLKNVNKPLLGHLRKANVPVVSRQLQEFLVSVDCLLSPGTPILATHFVPGQLVDVCGISKGKGFQGVMKRWNFKGNRASHGNSLSHRTLGSTGCRQDPGKVFKGKKMPGRMGGERITTQNLKILKIDATRNLLYIFGCIPGQSGGFLRVSDAVKGPFYPKDSIYPVPYPTMSTDDHQKLLQQYSKNSNHTHNNSPNNIFFWARTANMTTVMIEGEHIVPNDAVEIDPMKRIEVKDPYQL